PAAAIIASALLDAAAVEHPRPRFFVMPDDPRLGAYREEFAGLLGTVEVRPDDAVESEDFFDSLQASPRHRVDARAYLKARLMDLLMGDWDRHAGNWRWRPVPAHG